MAFKSWESLRIESPSDRKRLRDKAELRAAAILTNSYVASDEVDISQHSAVGLFFSVTKASLASFEYQIQQSFDAGSTWYNIGAESVALATITEGIPIYQRTLAGNEAWYKVINAVGERLRVQVKGTGTLTACSCTITIVAVY